MNETLYREFVTFAFFNILPIIVMFLSYYSKNFNYFFISGLWFLLVGITNIIYNYWNFFPVFLNPALILIGLAVIYEALTLPEKYRGKYTDE
jgi:hypothetical protein